MAKIKFFISIIAILTFLSCENSTKNEPQEINYDFEYFPFEINSSRNLKYFAVDSLGEFYPNSAETDIGTLKCTAKIEKDGKSCFRFDQYDNDGDYYSSEFYTYENDKLFLHQDFIKQLVKEAFEMPIDLPFTFEDPWLCLYDKNNSKVTFEEEKKDVQISESTLLNGNLNYTSESKIIENFELKNETSNCIELIINFNFEGYLSTTEDPDNKFDVTADFNVKFYIKKDFGKYYTVYLPSYVKMSDQSYNYGFYSILCY